MIQNPEENIGNITGFTTSKGSLYKFRDGRLYRQPHYEPEGKEVVSDFVVFLPPLELARSLIPLEHVGKLGNTPQEYDEIIQSFIRHDQEGDTYRAFRIVDQHHNTILQPEGVTPDQIQRLADTRNVFLALEHVPEDLITDPERDTSRVNPYIFIPLSKQAKEKYTPLDGQITPEHAPPGGYPWHIGHPVSTIIYEPK